MTETCLSDEVLVAVEGLEVEEIGVEGEEGEVANRFRLGILVSAQLSEFNPRALWIKL